MLTKLLKYKLPIPEREFEFRLPLGSMILGISQGVYLLISSDCTDGREEIRKFKLVKSEESFEARGLRYIDSTDDWHLYESIFEAKSIIPEGILSPKPEVEEHVLIQLKKLENPKNP